MERVIWCRGRRAGSRVAAAAAAAGTGVDALLLLPWLLEKLLMAAAVDNVDADADGSSKPWALPVPDMVSPCSSFSPLYNGNAPCRGRRAQAAHASESRRGSSPDQTIFGMAQ